MMYFLLILFFASLLSIIFMIGRKLAVLDHEQELNHEEVLVKVPYLKEITHLTVENAKKHGYSLLVVAIRLYIHGVELLKNKYEQIKIKIKNRIKKNNTNGEKKEISKFLKIIGDYKHKIRELTHKIKKDENLK